MKRLGSKTHPIPERVVSCNCEWERSALELVAERRILLTGLSLRETNVGLGFAGMNEVDKLDTVLDEKDRDVVCELETKSAFGRKRK